jgi:hypothetical protein
MSATQDTLLTLGEAAERLHAQTWRLARLFDRGLLPEPRRVGRCRVIAETDLPRIAEAMRRAGYLKTISPQSDAG